MSGLLEVSNLHVRFPLLGPIKARLLGVDEPAFLRLRGQPAPGRQAEPELLRDRLAKQSGGFGCYMQLAHEWANPLATHRSYELIAQRVMPEFQGQASSTLNACEHFRQKSSAGRTRPESSRDFAKS